MLRVIFLFTILASTSALAQQAPVQPNGIPQVVITNEDRPIIQESVAKLAAFLQTINDPSMGGRLRDVEHNAAQADEIDPRNVPILGMALSRNSQDPKACALLQRIEPSAVCVK